MGTQKTRMGGSTPPPTDDNEDLGLSEDMLPVSEDPSGFVASTPVQELAGRRVRPMNTKELERAHIMQAGNRPMFGDPSVQAGEGQGQTIQEPEDHKARKESPQARQRAEQIMPDFLRSGEIPPDDLAQAPEKPRRQSAKAAAQKSNVFQRTERFRNTAMALEHLLAEEENAKARGDYVSADQAHRMAESISETFEFERTHKAKPTHPALQKLRANLGLEIIKPTEIEWAGTKWLFAATNAKLDRWVSDEMLSDGMNIAALMIAAGLVGIDGVPIYEVLGVQLETTYVLKEKEDDGTISDFEPVTAKLYRKFCSCGEEVDVRDTVCMSCGAKHSQFDMPTDLRLKCAETFYNFLENEFGPYEELGFLLQEKNEIMKDRRMHKEELFPLAMRSKSQPETTT